MLMSDASRQKVEALQKSHSYEYFSSTASRDTRQLILKALVALEFSEDIKYSFGKDSYSVKLYNEISLYLDQYTHIKKETERNVLKEYQDEIYRLVYIFEMFNKSKR